MNRKVCKLIKQKILTGFFVLSCILSVAQNRNQLTGRVIDAGTRAPIPFANVFFGNTTIGMSAREDGTFSIVNFPAGKYDLTVTSIGYRTLQQSIDFTTPHKQVVEILLHESAVELNEIVVKEDTADWIRNYRMFKKLFIGTTFYTKKCWIVEPKNIHLFYDDETKELTAHSKKPIELMNEAFGLKIIYHLKSFIYNSKAGIFTVTGIPQIQYLKPKNKHEERKWIRERKRTYYGSVMNFMRVLLKDSLIQEGFVIRKIYQIRNKDRLPQKILDDKIRTIESGVGAHKKIKLFDDSLSYFLGMKQKPEFRDSVGKEELTANQLLKGTQSVDYHGKLQVTYRKEKEEWAYAQSLGKRTIDDQVSSLSFRGDTPLHIYTNGYYENQIDIFMEGYWSWSEKISCLLPLDYDPNLDIPKLK